ncbi:MAG: hypothetical protein H6737_30225 [Alphaproteobacteria bacterium]|nr:hypothetical protein [Alphaproteobacteria bacterium]
MCSLRSWSSLVLVLVVGCGPSPRDFVAEAARQDCGFRYRCSTVGTAPDGREICEETVANDLLGNLYDECLDYRRDLAAACLEEIEVYWRERACTDWRVPPDCIGDVWEPNGECEDGAYLYSP